MSAFANEHTLEGKKWKLAGLRRIRPRVQNGHKKGTEWQWRSALLIKVPRSRFCPRISILTVAIPITLASGKSGQRSPATSISSAARLWMSAIGAVVLALAKGRQVQASRVWEGPAKKRTFNRRALQPGYWKLLIPLLFMPIIITNVIFDST